MPLHKDKAKKAIEEKIAKPLGYDLYEAAAGMYQVINVNMAAAVREVAVKHGQDPRDFPLVVAGGAGPNHACMIALELENPVLIVPRESSIFCAAGMLMSDLKHDFVRTYAVNLADADPKTFAGLFDEMKDAGRKLLVSEGIKEADIEYRFALDLRYLKQ
jgi:N-methylhydantoinase A